jgi:bacterioferritin
MGTKGKAIVVDAAKIINFLNKALADEWLAYYQYWIGAQVLAGSMSETAKKELMTHANDELRHATMLSTRILKLEGTPILNPIEWAKQTNCGYMAPTNFSVTSILKQNIKGEQCAIVVYNNLLKFTKDKDPITYQLILNILTDEVEHEDDLERLLEDIEKKVK